MKVVLRKYISVMVLLLFCGALSAQDSAYKQTIKITSSYKPNLRDVVKIDLSATPPEADTSRPRLLYDVPPQNLFFGYNPVVLPPGTMAIDNTVLMGTRNYVKGGYGTYRTPYLEGALGYGDGKETLLKIYGDYISSRGKIKNADFSRLNVKGDGSLFTGTNEAYASLGFNLRENYQYGYDHDLFDFTKTDLRRSYRNMDLSVGIRNTEENDLGVSYNPHVKFISFTRENQVDESTLEVRLPAEKSITDEMKIKLAVNADINGYNLKASHLKLNKTLVQIEPVVTYNSDFFNLAAGITPAWNEGESTLLPNFYGDIKLDEFDFTIQGGWIGSYKANNFNSLSLQNPYISDPLVLHNTKETQYFGGIKGSIGGHFNYNAKAAYITYKDIPLFANDIAEPWKFSVVNESRLHNFQIHGDLNYIDQDRFSVTAGLDLNSYSGLKDNMHTWGLYPLKISGSLRWKPIELLTLKSDLAAFSGAKALLPGGNDKSLSGGTDLSIGAEFKINKMFSVWLDVNNLLNSEYEYWNNYPVLGLQAIGGAIVRF